MRTPSRGEEGLKLPIPDLPHPPVVHLPIALAMLAAGVAVGHSGGELDYKYRAASVHAREPQSLLAASANEAPSPRHDTDE